MVFSFFYCVASTGSATVLYLLLLTVPELVEGTFLFLFPVISTSSITVLYLLLLSVPEPVEGTFSFLIPVISTPLNHRVAFGAWACRRHILIPLPCDFDSAQSPCYIYYYSRCLSLSKARSPSSSLWFLLRSITVLYLLLLPVPELVEGTENWCLSLSKAHSYSSSLLIFNFPGNLSF